MNDNQKVIQCYHCGNETLMNLLSEHKEYSDEGLNYYFIYKTYLCPVCNKVTLYEVYWDEFLLDYDSSGKIVEAPTEEILYPVTSIDFTDIPPQVASAYTSALKCRNIDPAICLMALRRTLEVVCQDKNATGRDLWRKIEDLSEKGILPSELKHASSITRLYGNMGAHDTQVQVSRSDVNLIFEFVKYILDYLYILPAKLKEMQEKMSHQQSNAPMLEQIGTAPESVDNENA